MKKMPYQRIDYNFHDFLMLPVIHGRDPDHRRALEADVNILCAFHAEMELIRDIHDRWTAPPPGEPYVGPRLTYPGLPYTPALSSL